MSFYVVWNKDTSMIEQGNKIYFPDEQYEAQANELGQNFFKAHATETYSFEDYYAPNGVIAPRPDMNILLDSDRIQSGDKGAAIFSGLPRPVTWHLICMGMIVHTDTSTKGGLEVQVPVPGLYTVRFEKLPYKRSDFTFEAV